MKGFRRLLNCIPCYDSFCFILSNIPLDETASYYLYVLFDEVFPLLDVESSKDRSSTEIFLSNEIPEVDFSSSSKELFNEVTKDSFGIFEVVHSYFNS